VTAKLTAFVVGFALAQPVEGAEVIWLEPGL
jgi:hypothetical protein